MKKKSKWLWAKIGLAGFALLIALEFHEKILLDAGRFMAPVDDSAGQVADVIILEGTEHISKELIARAAGMLSAGKAGQLAVVLSRKPPGEAPSAPPWADPSGIEKAMEGMGLDGSVCRVIVTPFRHPATLTSAQTAMSVLAGEGVKSAILISPGFHARRSYLVYQHIGDPLQIRIRPHASFDGHNHGLDRWWTQQHAVYDFVEQVLKLAYYLVRGYIPLKLSY